MRKWSFLWDWLAIAYIHQSHAPLHTLHGSVNNDQNRFTFERILPSFMSMFDLLHCDRVTCTKKKNHRQRNMHVAHHIHILHYTHNRAESSECLAYIYCISYEIDFDCTMLVDDNRVDRHILNWIKFSFFQI